jgi:hypothetical protein
MGNRTDLALDLATQTTAPSWYDFVLTGPGTLQEEWNKQGPANQTVQTSGSLNHVMLGGGIDPWLYHTVGGLRPPSLKNGSPVLAFGAECEIMLRVRGATAETMIHGHRARSSWSWDDVAGAGGTLSYNATVPVGFRASLTIPTTCGGMTMAVAFEGKTVIWNRDQEAAGTALQKQGVVSVDIGHDLGVFNLLSGHYSFRGRYD